MKYANPAPLGLFGFALTTWLLGMVNAGWFGDASLPMVLAMPSRSAAQRNSVRA